MTVNLIRWALIGAVLWCIGGLIVALIAGRIMRHVGEGAQPTPQRSREHPRT